MPQRYQFFSIGLKLADKVFLYIVGIAADTKSAVDDFVK